MGTFSMESGSLDFDDVLSLQALWTFRHGKFHCLAFAQRFKPSLLNGGMVYEDILTGFTLNESVTLRIIEPLDGSLLFHTQILS
jgi:hypothetical protein